jgi:phosphate transport system substrate-binding protein
MKNLPMAVCVILLGLTACKKSAPITVVKVDGSSTVFPISEAVAEDFQKQHATRVTIGVSGTGGGFKKFCNGELAMTGASRPITPKEIETCKAHNISYIELPIAYDGIVIVVNPANTWADKLTVDELKKMWSPEAQTKITKWSQIRSTFPEKEMHLFGAGVDSGTYDYFTKAIVGTEHASRGDYTSSEDDNVLVQGVANDPAGLGFFGYAYYAENSKKLKALPISVGAGEPVMPSAESIKDGSYQPLSRPIFIYVKTPQDEATAEFARFYIQNAARLANAVGYISLSDKAYELALDRFNKQKTGTAFSGGSQIGVTVEQLLLSEAK